MTPLDKKNEKWKVQLNNGTSLDARFQQKVLDLTLAMGPKNIRLPLSEIRHMNRQEIIRYDLQAEDSINSRESSRAYESGGRPGLGRSIFYSNKAQQSAKIQAAKSWKRVKK